jgi:biotin operon repressor
MATKPTTSDVIAASRIEAGRNPYDAKYDVNGDGVVDITDVQGLNKASVGKDPGFAFVGDIFFAEKAKTPQEYAAIEKANQERIAAEQKETERRQGLIADARDYANKYHGFYGGTATEGIENLVASNPNLTAGQLASLSTKNTWAKQVPVFSRVMEAMENGTAKLEEISLGSDEFGNDMRQLVIGNPKDPNSYLNLRETSQPGVYQFSTFNPTSAGTLSGVIQADPKTGKYTPIQDYTKQVQYTPGQGGGLLGSMIGSFGDIIKELGPIATVVGNAIAPGLGTALSLATAIDEGANPADIAKTIAIAEGVNQLGVSSDVSQATGSQATGQVAAGTVQGLLSGQNLEDALTSGLKSVKPVNEFEAEVNQVLDLPATQETLISGQDLAADNITGNTATDVITSLVTDAINNAVTGQDLAADSVTGNTVNDIVTAIVADAVNNAVSGQDLAADSVAGNTVQDVITNLVNNIAMDTLVSGQDLAADSITGNTLQDVITTLVNTGTDTLVSGQDLAADSITGNTLQDVITTLADNIVTGTDTIGTTSDTIGTTSDTIGTTSDTLLSGQDLSADTVTGSTLQDIVNVLNQDTIVSGQDLASDLGTGTANTLEDISNALAGEGSLISGQDLASDLGTGTANTLEDISIALATEGSDISGQDLAADNTAGNTLTDIANVITTNNDTGGGATVDDVIKTLSDVAKVASIVGVADSVLNNETQPTQRTGFDIVPVPTDWKSPVYDQSFTPIDLNSILDNINRLQNTQWATPRTYGGAYMGTPVNISDIVNQIMGAELTPQSMPSNITNAVGGILGSSTTR